MRKLSKVVGNLTKLGIKHTWKWGGKGIVLVLRFVKIEDEIYEKLGMGLRTHEQICKGFIWIPNLLKTSRWKGRGKVE